MVVTSPEEQKSRQVMERVEQKNNARSRSEDQRFEKGVGERAQMVESWLYKRERGSGQSLERYLGKDNLRRINETN
jgi:hypothetical protein